MQQYGHIEYSGYSETPSPLPPRATYRDSQGDSDGCLHWFIGIALVLAVAVGIGTCFMPMKEPPPKPPFEGCVVGKTYEPARSDSKVVYHGVGHGLTKYSTRHYYYPARWYVVLENSAGERNSFSVTELEWTLLTHGTCITPTGVANGTQDVG